MRHVVFAAIVAIVGAAACGESGRVDPASLTQTTAGPALRVTILGRPNDPRIPFAREAIHHWNSEFTRLGMHIRLDSAIIDSARVPEDRLRAASGGKTRAWSVFLDNRLRSALSDVPGDIVIALSTTDFISFGVPWRGVGSGGKAIVGLRRADIPPLSLPNTVRNVVAHELGHVLGLDHNTDSTMLMCGRPATCRPALFASDTTRFFPLTAEDERLLRRRWP